MSHFWEKCWTVGQTDRQQWLYRTLLRMEVELLKQLWAFLNLYQHTKNQFIPWISLWDTTNFRILWPELAHSFLTTISMGLYEHAKSQSFSLFYSRAVVDLKILQSDWAWAFFQIWDLSKLTAINMDFLYRPNCEKIN